MRFRHRCFRHLLLAATSVSLTATALGDASPDPTTAPYGNRIDRAAGWARPRSDERMAERRMMVDRQLAGRDITDKAVLDAMRNVPRHWFMPENTRHLAYQDRPVGIGEGQTISQPYIVALMTQALALNKNSKVLEVGTGSGYQAAVLAEITPHVYTIEIVEPLAKRAMATFERHGYDTIKTRIGDGYVGWKEHAPFDAIIVTCAPERIPAALIVQLKPGGRLCIPVGAEFGAQWLRLVTKKKDGSLAKKDLLPVRFVPMTGDAQAPKKDN